MECPFEGCNKIFNSKSVLERHMRVHSGDKPYECHICGKKFTQSSNLKRHMKNHESEHLRWDRSTPLKPFQCSICQRSFTAKSSLQYHVFTAHRDSSVCSDIENKDNKVLSHCLHSGCTETFCNTNDLRRHVLTTVPGLQAEFEFLKSSLMRVIRMNLMWEDIDTSLKEVYREEIQSLKAILHQHFDMEIDSKDFPKREEMQDPLVAEGATQWLCLSQMASKNYPVFDPHRFVDHRVESTATSRNANDFIGDKRRRMEKASFNTISHWGANNTDRCPLKEQQLLQSQHSTVRISPRDQQCKYQGNHQQDQVQNQPQYQHQHQHQHQLQPQQLQSYPLENNIWGLDQPGAELCNEYLEENTGNEEGYKIRHSKTLEQDSLEEWDPLLDSMESLLDLCTNVSSDNNNLNSSCNFLHSGWESHYCSNVHPHSATCLDEGSRPNNANEIIKKTTKS